MKDGNVVSEANGIPHRRNGEESGVWRLGANAGGTHANRAEPCACEWRTIIKPHAKFAKKMKDVNAATSGSREAWMPKSRIRKTISGGGYYPPKKNISRTSLRVSATPREVLVGRLFFPY